MSILEASLGLIICIIGTGVLFRLARRKKQKKFIFIAAVFFLVAILFASYLTLAALFLTRDDSGNDDDIPGRDWRTYRGYSSAGNISEGQNSLGLLYFLYDNNQLGFHLDSETRTSVLSVDLNDADDPRLSMKNMKLEDLNFDGYKDLRIPISHTKGNVTYKCYLWNRAQAVFVYSSELSALPGIEVDAAAKVIKSVTYTNSEKSTEKNYRWQNGKLLTTN